MINVDRKGQKKYKKNIDDFDIKKCSNKFNLIKNIITNINYIGIFIIKYLLIICLFKLTKNNSIYFNYSIITLIIKGESKRTSLGNILSNMFEGINYLQKVTINGNIQDISNEYYFNETDNFIKLIWYNNISNCNYMFSECKKIVEINLSNCDSSHVTSMESMFQACSSLTSLDLSNFNTSNVESMKDMFNGCILLTSLNLSNFNTSKVMKCLMNVYH